MNADFRNTSRREFLKQSLQTSLALGIAGLVPKSLVAGDKNEAIIIIGAGIAGLAALRTLISQGYTNVAVLEGRDRIGGRMWTETAPSAAFRLILARRGRMESASIQWAWKIPSAR